MLCSLKTHRPDKLLQKRLVLLAYSLITLTLSLVAFCLYPEYVIYTISAMLVMTLLCLYLTIQTLGAGEEAISYGGFANEILKDNFKIKRIDNSKLEPVLQNNKAFDFFKNENILRFLEKHLHENRQNKPAFTELKTACSNLRETTVNLSLNINNQEEWFEVYLRPIFLKKADIFEGAFSVKAIKKDTYLLWCIKETTATKNMEQIFNDEKKALHDFLDYLPVGLYICDKNYDIEYVNHAMAKTLGYSREILSKSNLKNLIVPDTQVPAKHSDWQGNIYLLHKDKEIIECFCAQESFRHNQEIKARGVIVGNLPTDAELKTEINNAFDKISWLFDASPISTIFIDKSGDIKDCNQSSLVFFNTERDKLINKNIFDYINADDYNNLKTNFRQIYDGENFSSALDVMIRQGKEEKMALIYASPMKKIHSSNATITEGLVLYLMDTTEQKNLELKFAQAQKMQAMGQLAGGVAHDFNNLLTAMIGFCDLLLQKHGVGDPSFADLIQIKQNANRAAGLVRQLLAFSRKQPLKPKLIDVSENFVELSHMLKRILGEQIILKFHHGSDLGFTRVDPVQFSQVIINLAVNAKDAMNNHGTLTISSRVERLSEPYQFGADLIKPGEFIVIDVKDTGCGISSENLTRIFEPFFSTKQNIVGSGTGLGLSTVYGITRQTEGFIKVQTALGLGTTFSIYLPRFENNLEEEENIIESKIKEVITNEEGTQVLKVQERNTTSLSIDKKLILGLNLSSIDRSDSSTNNTEARILFVEDEDSVRSFAVRALQKKGYDVIGCNSAENALNHLKTDKNFQLLITDMMMPGMSGTDLAKIVKNDINNIKIILASGYSEEIARKELSADDEFEFMAKPFSLGDLTKKVFDILKN